jgi:uncharacterized protein YjgD (DUF1641 family)/nucleotide-binding universal stress UspA family protein
MVDDELTILVGLDSLKDIEDTVVPAIELAKTRGGKIVALVTINVSQKTGANWEEIYDTIKKEKADPIIKKVKQMCKKDGVSVSAKVKRGNPSKILSEAAKKEKADIVIVKPTAKNGTNGTEKTYELFGADEGEDMITQAAEEIKTNTTSTSPNSAITTGELNGMAELLDTMNQNIDSLSEVVTKMVTINELLDDSGPIIKGAFYKSLQGLDGVSAKLSTDDGMELAETLLENTQTFSSLVKKTVAINELMADYAPIMKGAFERSLVTLDQMDQTVNLEDATVLLETVLKNTKAFSGLAGSAAGVHELISDASPILSQAFAKSLVTLDNLQRNGAMERVAKFAGIMEMLYNNISDEEMERLGINVLLAIDIFNRAMRPEIVSVVHSLLDTVVTCQNQHQEEGPKKVGMFNYVSVMRDPDIQMSVGFMTSFLKNLNVCLEKAQAEEPLISKPMEETQSKTAAEAEE